MGGTQRAVWRNVGSTPQTILWEIERYSPAGSVVEVATLPSRFDVVGNPYYQNAVEKKLKCCCDIQQRNLSLHF